MDINLILGDCLDSMKKMEDNSVDAIVADPPYGLSFMGKHWDYDVPDIAIWQECLRVLKPGGHLLSFAGTRTYHRMVVRIEDAGFEIRDMISWIYGSGFPKSLNIGKAVDKINGEIGRLIKFVKWYRTTGMRQKETNEIIGKSDVGSHYLRLDQPAIPTRELWAILRPHIKTEIPKWVDELVERIEREREVVGKDRKADLKDHVFFGDINKAQENGKAIGYGEWDITKGTSEWEGWGTALKPSCEPCVLARKPLGEKTVAENCLKWGVGGINIDGCRVGAKGGVKKINIKTNSASHGGEGFGCNGELEQLNKGRFPANLIHDGSDEVLELFPTMGEKSEARFFYCAKASKAERNRGCEGLYILKDNTPKEDIDEIKNLLSI